MGRLVVLLILVGLAFPAAASAAEGDLDLSFNGIGKVTTLVGSSSASSSVDSLAIDSQGRPVAIGQSTAPGDAFVIARYRPNGSLDSSCNGNGIAGTSIGSDSSARAGTLDHLGRIIAVGLANDQTNPMGPPIEHFALARFNPDCSLDTTFNSTGTLDDTHVSSFDEARAVAVDSQNRIVICGTTLGSSGEDFGLVRYSVNGSHDSTFGSEGAVTTDFASGIDECQGIAIDPQGRILAAGVSQQTGGTKAVLARYTAGGQLDPSFGTGGRVTINFGSSGAASVILDPQGRILFTAGGSVFRLLSGGQLDPSFGVGGRASPPANVAVSSLTLDPQGRVVAAGSSGSTATDFAVVRFLANGHLDSSFNGTGVVLTAVAQNSNATGVAIDSHERIVAAGAATPSGGNSEFALARYIGDATPPVAHIVSGPASGGFTNQRQPRFGFTSSEAGSTFACRIDFLPLAACTSPYAPGVALADGRHTFGVVAIDPAGNASIQVTRTFTVDTIAPRLRITARRGHGGAVSFHIRSSEPVRLKCGIDRHRLKPCRSHYTPSKLTAGHHVLHVRATDRAGNVTRASKRFAR